MIVTKIFLSILATTLTLYSMNITSSNVIAQKKLNSMQDYNQMVSDLKSSSIMGNNKATMLLGTLIYNGIKLDDGTIIQENKIAGSLILQDSIFNGSIDALALLVMKSMANNDIDIFKNTIKVMQESTIIDNANKDYYTTLFAGYVIDNNINDSLAIEVATKWLYEAEQVRPTYKIQYILSGMYRKLNNIDAANFYFNKSCQAIEMKDICKKYKVSHLSHNFEEDSCAIKKYIK